MDVRTKDKEGLTICPICKKHYKPNLTEVSKTNMCCIQDIYPEAKSYEREQLITGICSNECWNKLFSPEEDE